MGVDDRIDALKEKHRVLDQQIQEETARPIPDEITLSDLKKQKLRIKDQLAHLGAG